MVEIESKREQRERMRQNMKSGHDDGSLHGSEEEEKTSGKN